MRCVFSVAFLYVGMAFGASQSYPESDSHIYYFGPWSTLANVGGTGQSGTLGAAAVGVRFDFVAIGTAATVRVWGGQEYTVTVDGTPTATTPGAQWQDITAFSGLADSAHLVSVRTTAVSAAFFVQSATAITVTGASPSLQAPAGYGPQYPVGSGAFASFGRLDGSPAMGTVQQHPNTARWTTGDGGARFRASATDVWAWVNAVDGAGPILLLRDGVQVGSVIPVVANAWSLLHLGAGLDSNSALYEVVNAGTTSAGQGFYLYSLMLGGGAGLDTAQPPAKLTIAWYGDSIISQVSGGLTSSTQGAPWIMARATGTAALRKGTSSQPVSTYLRDNTAQITGVAPKPRIAILEGGVNDEAGSKVIGDCNTAGSFQGDMKTMIANVGTGLAAGSAIYIQGILPNTYSNSAARATYTGAQAAAVACYMATSPTVPAYFISTDNWIDPATDTIEGLHPNATGYAKIAARWAPIIKSALGMNGVGAQFFSIP